MEIGDTQKESIDKGFEPTPLKGAENPSKFLLHNNMEAVISHNKPKKDANFNVIAQGIFQYYYQSYLCDIAFCI